MGSRGPVPKRTEERRRRNEDPAGPVSKPEELTEEDLVALDIDPEDIHAKIARGAGLPIPEADSAWHEYARDLYESLSYSGQAVYMRPSDWAMARLLCESLSRDLEEQVVGITEDGDVVKAEIPLKGASLSAYLKAFGNLGVTEGDRRRMRIELPALQPTRGTAQVRDISSARRSRVS